MKASCCRYDFIIAGAGPSGLICAKLLADSGFRCLILERKKEIGEKVCGGGVSCRSVAALRRIGMNPDELVSLGAVPIFGNFIFREGKSRTFKYPDGEYALGVKRKIFDGWLFKHATMAGVETIFGAEATIVERYEDCCAVNGMICRDYVMATGANGRLSSGVTKRVYSFGISAIIRNKIFVEKDLYNFWYPDADQNKYFWAFPVGEDVFNIGVWAQKWKKGDQRCFYYGIEHYLNLSEKRLNYETPPRGAFVGSGGRMPGVADSVYAIGDCAGLASESTGEGLLAAILSAENTASLLQCKFKDIQGKG